MNKVKFRLNLFKRGYKYERDGLYWQNGEVKRKARERFVNKFGSLSYNEVQYEGYWDSPYAFTQWRRAYVKNKRALFDHLRSEYTTASLTEKEDLVRRMIYLSKRKRHLHRLHRCLKAKVRSKLSSMEHEIRKQYM